MDELDESEFDEVYVLVADQRRVSRNVRFSWYTDALSGQNDPYDRQAPLHIIGQMPPPPPDDEGVTTVYRTGAW